MAPLCLALHANTSINMWLQVTGERLASAKEQQAQQASVSEAPGPTLLPHPAIAIQLAAESSSAANPATKDAGPQVLAHAVAARPSCSPNPASTRPAVVLPATPGKPKGFQLPFSSVAVSVWKHALPLPFAFASSCGTANSQSAACLHATQGSGSTMFILQVCACGC